MEEVQKIEKDKIFVKRRLERGIEIVSCSLPMVMTVNGSAPDCRARNAKLIMKYKHAKTVTELQNSNEDYLHLYNDRPYLNIPEWTVSDIEVEHDEFVITSYSIHYTKLYETFSPEM